MTASAKRFTIDKQSDPVDFLSWFLNALHAELTGGRRKRPSIISRCFQARAAPSYRLGLHLEQHAVLHALPAGYSTPKSVPEGAMLVCLLLENSSPFDSGNRAPSCENACLFGKKGV